MQHPVARYAVLVLGVAACILLALPVLPWLTSARGVAGPGASDAVHPVPAAVAMVLGAAAFTAVACVVGRLINAAPQASVSQASGMRVSPSKAASTT
ncbi:MAG: hypothetical protein ACKOGJ_03260, partial [Phycisphaerales bacterium]